MPDLRSILLDLTDAVEGRTAPRPVPEPTKLKPFNLTAPKARMVPIPKIVRICFVFPSKYILVFIINLASKIRKSSTGS